MATYKVIQDIEAEDKLIGPLTLRQFIYAGIAALCLYLGFIFVTKHLTIFLLILLPIFLLSGFFAFPWKLNQPTETWALAMIRFIVKPKKRVWNQSGVKELVTITAPKIEQIDYTNNLSEGEVKGRLRSLADVLDSRGWAVKNGASSFNYRANAALNSDRLLTIAPTDQAIVESVVPDSADILDEQTNPTAQRFNQMINSSSQARFSDIKSRLNSPKATTPTTNIAQQSVTAMPPIIGRGDDWFIKGPHYNQGTGSVNSVLFESKPQKTGYIKASKDLKTAGQIAETKNTSPATTQPHATATASPAQPAVAPPVTQQSNPVILNFASNNDLNIATLARQINQQQGDGMQREVIIQLH